jgi:hypothetical protein
VYGVWVKRERRKGEGGMEHEWETRARLGRLGLATAAQSGEHGTGIRYVPFDELVLRSQVGRKSKVLYGGLIRGR